MSWRIGLCLLPVLATGALLAGFFTVALDAISSAEASADILQRKMAAAQDLQSAMATYNLRVAQVIYQGSEPQGDLRTARLAMERGFQRLGQAARDQAAAAASGTETRSLLTGVENARRMLELYHAIDLSAARAFVLKRDGQQGEALDTYARDVDFRLTSELSTLLDDALVGDQRDLATLRSALADRIQITARIGFALAAAFVFSLLLSWYLLSRQARRQMPALAADFENRAQELREANRRLRETDTRRARFLADVSHELRTPLTILRGEADVALLAGSGPEEQRRSLERIQDQAGELAQLLDDLIAFARSDAEADSLSLAPTLLDDVLATAVAEAEILAEPREVSLVLDLLDKGQWILADRRRIKQALLIGIDNAINHSPPGSRIDVLLSRQNSMARTSILDRGPGISDTDSPRVFDRFYRGDTSANAAGLGIGLAIAKGIVDQHNGAIALANRAGGGAELTIDLPPSGEAVP